MIKPPHRKGVTSVVRTFKAWHDILDHWHSRVPAWPPTVTMPGIFATLKELGENFECLPSLAVGLKDVSLKCRRSTFNRRPRV